jgi:hypothetical protein
MIFAPVFAREKQYEKGVTGFTIGAVNTAVTLDGVSGLAAGRHGFVASSTGTLVEYLGRILTVNGLVVTCRLVAQRARNAGDRFWVAKYVWQAASVPSVAEYDREVDPGIATLETTGAVPLRTRVRDVGERVRLTLGSAAASDWAGYLDWLRDRADWGLGQFTAAWRDQDKGVVRTAVVALGATERGFQTRVPLAGLRTWEMELVVAGEDGYL